MNFIRQPILVPFPGVDAFLCEFPSDRMHAVLREKRANLSAHLTKSLANKQRSESYLVNQLLNVVILQVSDVESPGGTLVINISPSPSLDRSVV